MKKLAPISAITLALLLGSGSAWANPPAAAPLDYISGGIGESEIEQMQARKKDYNLLLTFAEAQSGSYLADVKVDIINAKQETVLSTQAKGPFLYAKLPAGHYTIKATLGEQTQSYQYRAPGPRQHVFYFKP